MVFYQRMVARKEQNTVAKIKNTKSRKNFNNFIEKQINKKFT